jgi:hypothetical protein
VIRLAGCRDCFAEQQRVRQCRAGHSETGHAPDEVAESIRRWKRLTVYTRAQMEDILVGKLIATSAKQIGMFLVILAIVSAAIVAFIIYSLTMDKIREIAVLKLIGTRNRTIAAMIMQQALARRDRFRGRQDHSHLQHRFSQICAAHANGSAVGFSPCS